MAVGRIGRPNLALAWSEAARPARLARQIGRRTRLASNAAMPPAPLAMSSRQCERYSYASLSTLRRDASAAVMGVDQLFVKAWLMRREEMP